MARGTNTTPRIGLYQIDLGLSKDEYDPPFLELAEQVDDWVRIAPLFPEPELATVFMIPQDKIKRTNVRNVELHHGTILPQKACFWAGNSFNITPSGDVHVCLLSHSADGCVGNLLEDDVKTILSNAKAFVIE